MEHLLIEPAIVPDVFASGLAEIEDLGDGNNYRFTFYVQQKTPQNYSGIIEYVVVARIIMPVIAIHEAVRATMRVMGIQCEERVRKLAH